MLKITQAAWERLLELRSTRPNLTAMRLTQVDGRLKCFRGVEKASDRVIRREGCPDVLMTPSVAKKMSNRTLDAPNTVRGRRFRLRRKHRPSAK